MDTRTPANLFDETDDQRDWSGPFDSPEEALDWLGPVPGPNPPQEPVREKSILEANPDMLKDPTDISPDELADSLIFGKSKDVQSMFTKYSENPEYLKALAKKGALYEELSSLQSEDPTEEDIAGAINRVEENFKQMDEADILFKGEDMFAKFQQQEIKDVNERLQSGSDKRGWLMNSIAAFATGAQASLVENVAGISYAIGADEFGDKTMDFVDKIRTGVFAPDEEFRNSFIGKAIDSIGAQAPQLALGGAVGASIRATGATALLKRGAAALGSKTTPLIGKAATSVAELATNTAGMVPLNFGREFLDGYEGYLADGYSKEEAYKRAWGYSAGATLLESAADAVLFGTYKSILPVFAKAPGAIKEMVDTGLKFPDKFVPGSIKVLGSVAKGAAVEGPTEGAQRAFQNLLGARMLGEGVAEEALIGATVGAVLGGGGGTLSAINDRTQAKSKSLTEQALDRLVEGLDTTQIERYKSKIDYSPFQQPGTYQVDDNLDLSNPEALGGVKQAVANNATVSVDGRPVTVQGESLLYSDDNTKVPEIAHKVSIQPDPNVELPLPKLQEFIAKVNEAYKNGEIDQNERLLELQLARESIMEKAILDGRYDAHLDEINFEVTRSYIEQTEGIMPDAYVDSANKTINLKEQLLKDKDNRKSQIIDGEKVYEVKEIGEDGVIVNNGTKYSYEQITKADPTKLRLRSNAFIDPSKATKEDLGRFGRDINTSHKWRGTKPNVESEVYKKLKGAKTGAQLLDVLEKSDNPMYKSVARILKSNRTINWENTKINYGEFGEMEAAGAHMGNEIFINTSPVRESSGTPEGLALHELLHPLIEKISQSNPKALAKIEALYNKYKEAVGGNVSLLNENALRSPIEFVSELMTNPTVQAEVRNLDKQTGFFEGIKRDVSSLFSPDPVVKGDPLFTAVEELINLSEKTNPPRGITDPTITDEPIQELDTEPTTPESTTTGETTKAETTEPAVTEPAVTEPAVKKPQPVSREAMEAMAKDLPDPAQNKRYEEARGSVPKGVLAQRRGDNIYFFDDDAVNAAEILNLPIREFYGRRVASIPAERSVAKLNRLVRRGLDVHTIPQEGAPVKHEVKGRFEIPYSPLGVRDIIDEIVVQGGIISLPKDQRESNSNYNDMPGNITGVYRQIMGGQTLTPDQMAQTLQAENFGDGTVPTMWQLIGEAIASRKSIAKQTQQQEDIGEALIKQYNTFSDEVLSPKNKKKKLRIPTDLLLEGDVLKVGDNEIKVTNINTETMEVTLDGGDRYGIQEMSEGSSFYVDRAPTDLFDRNRPQDVDAPFSRTNKPKQAVSPEVAAEVEAEINSLAERFNRRVTTTTSTDTTEAYYDPSTDTLVFNLDNIPSKERAAELFFHEATHGNIATLNATPEAKADLNKILELSKNNLMENSEQTAQNAGFDSFQSMLDAYGYKPTDTTQILGELLARKAEQLATQKPTWLSNLLNDITIWFKKHFNIDFNSDNILRILSKQMGTKTKATDGGIQRARKGMEDENDIDYIQSQAEDVIEESEATPTTEDVDKPRPKRDVSKLSDEQLIQVIESAQEGGRPVNMELIEVAKLRDNERLAELVVEEEERKEPIYKEGENPIFGKKEIINLLAKIPGNDSLLTFTNTQRDIFNPRANNLPKHLFEKVNKMSKEESDKMYREYKRMGKLYRRTVGGDAPVSFLSIESLVEVAREVNQLPNKEDRNNRMQALANMYSVRSQQLDDLIRKSDQLELNLFGGDARFTAPILDPLITISALEGTLSDTYYTEDGQLTGALTEGVIRDGKLTSNSRLQEYNRSKYLPDEAIRRGWSYFPRISEDTIQLPDTIRRGWSRGKYDPRVTGRSVFPKTLTLPLPGARDALPQLPSAVKSRALTVVSQEDKVNLGLVKDDSTAEPTTPLNLQEVANRLKVGEPVRFTMSEEQATPPEVFANLDIIPTEDGGVVVGAMLDGKYVSTTSDLSGDIDVSEINKLRTEYVDKFNQANTREATLKLANEYVDKFNALTAASGEIVATQEAPAVTVVNLAPYAGSTGLAGLDLTSYDALLGIPNPTNPKGHVRAFSMLQNWLSKHTPENVDAWENRELDRTSVESTRERIKQRYAKMREDIATVSQYVDNPKVQSTIESYKDLEIGDNSAQQIRESLAKQKELKARVSALLGDNQLKEFNEDMLGLETLAKIVKDFPDHMSKTLDARAEYLNAIDKEVARIERFAATDMGDVVDVDFRVEKGKLVKSETRRVTKRDSINELQEAYEAIPFDQETYDSLLTQLETLNTAIPETRRRKGESQKDFENRKRVAEKPKTLDEKEMETLTQLVEANQSRRDLREAALRTITTVSKLSENEVVTGKIISPPTDLAEILEAIRRAKKLKEMDILTKLRNSKLRSLAEKGIGGVRVLLKNTATPLNIRSTKEAVEVLRDEQEVIVPIPYVDGNDIMISAGKAVVTLDAIEPFKNAWENIYSASGSRTPFHIWYKNLISYKKEVEGEIDGGFTDILPASDPIKLEKLAEPGTAPADSDISNLLGMSELEYRASLQYIVPTESEIPPQTWSDAYANAKSIGKLAEELDSNPDLVEAIKNPGHVYYQKDDFFYDAANIERKPGIWTQSMRESRGNAPSHIIIPTSQDNVINLDENTSPTDIIRGRHNLIGDNNKIVQALENGTLEAASLNYSPNLTARLEEAKALVQNKPVANFFRSFLRGFVGASRFAGILDHTRVITGGKAGSQKKAEKLASELDAAISRYKKSLPANLSKEEKATRIQGFHDAINQALGAFDLSLTPGEKAIVDRNMKEPGNFGNLTKAMADVIARKELTATKLMEDAIKYLEGIDPKLVEVVHEIKRDLKKLTGIQGVYDTHVVNLMISETGLPNLTHGRDLEGKNKRQSIWRSIGTSKTTESKRLENLSIDEKNAIADTLINTLAAFVEANGGQKFLERRTKGKVMGINTKGMLANIGINRNSVWEKFLANATDPAHKEYFANIFGKDFKDLESQINNNILPKEVADAIGASKISGVVPLAIILDATNASAKASLIDTLTETGHISRTAKKGSVNLGLRLKDPALSDLFANEDVMVALEDVLGVNDKPSGVKRFINANSGLAHRAVTSLSSAGNIRQWFTPHMFAISSGMINPLQVSTDFKDAYKAVYSMYKGDLPIPFQSSKLGDEIPPSHPLAALGFKRWFDLRVVLAAEEIVDSEVGLRNLKAAQDKVSTKDMEAAVEAMLEGKGALMSSVMSRFDTGFQFSDNSGKVALLIDSLRVEQQAHPEWFGDDGMVKPEHRDEVLRRAGSYTRTMMPTMTLQYGWAEQLRSLHLASFVSFLSEATRITINTPLENLAILGERGKYAWLKNETDLARSVYKRRAVRSLAGYGAGAFIVPQILTLITRAIFGIDEEEEDQARALMADFERNSNSLVFFKDSEGRVRHMNLEFINYFSVIFGAPQAAVRTYFQEKDVKGDTKAAVDALGVAAQTLFGQALSLQIFPAAAVEAAFNTRLQGGGTLVNPQSDLLSQARGRGGHVVNTLIPAPLRFLVEPLWNERATNIYTGKDARGETISRLDEISRALIPRERRMPDANRLANSQAIRISRDLSDARRLFTNALRDNKDEGTIKAAADRYRDVWVDRMFHLSKIIPALEPRGLSRSEFFEIAGRNGLDRKSLRAAAAGKINDITISQRALASAEEASKRKYARLLRDLGIEVTK